MKPSLFKRIHIFLHMKIFKITNQKLLKNYIVVFKYNNKIGYFTDAIGLNKKDVIEKTRVLVYNSSFFDDLEEQKKIQVIAVEREDN